MTQKHILATNLLARIGRESTFGTTSTHMIRIVLNGVQNPLGESKREMLANNDSSVYQHDFKSPTQGLQMGSPLKCSVSLKRLAARLDASASSGAYPAVDGASALSHQILFDHWLGGSRVDRGSTVAASPSPTAGGFTVGSGHGTRFAKGGIIIVNGLPRVVTGISGDALTIRPDLPSAPSAGDAVLNTFSFYRAESHEQTLTFETAFAETNTPETQRRGRGCYGQCAWTAEVGKVPTIAFEGVSTAHDGPGDLSITVADAADDMGAPIRWDGIAYLFDGTSAPSAAVVESSKITVPNKWATPRCGSGTETVNGAVMVGGREGHIKIELLVRHDAGEHTHYAAGDVRDLLLYTQVGSGSAQRFDGWYFPRVEVVEEPVNETKDNLVYTKLSLVAHPNTTIAGSPLGSTSTDLERSPCVLFLG